MPNFVFTPNWELPLLWLPQTSEYGRQLGRASALRHVLGILVGGAAGYALKGPEGALVGAAAAVVVAGPGYETVMHSLDLTRTEFTALEGG